MKVKITKVEDVEIDFKSLLIETLKAIQKDSKFFDSIIIKDGNIFQKIEDDYSYDLKFISIAGKDQILAYKLINNLKEYIGMKHEKF